MELFQALAIFVMIGCFIALAWFFSRALRLKSVSINLICYEVLILVFIIFSSLIVDYIMFNGDLILNPLFGQGMINYIHNVFNTMSYALRSFVMFMMLCIVISVSFVFYYLFSVKPEAA
jgi:hypothetical protein